jgi:hypothetical protein
MVKVALVPARVWSQLYSGLKSGHERETKRCGHEVRQLASANSQMKCPVDVQLDIEVRRDPAGVGDLHCGDSHQVEIDRGPSLATLARLSLSHRQFDAMWTNGDGDGPVLVSWRCSFTLTRASAN